MPGRKIVERFIEDGEEGRVVVTREADGSLSRTPVIKTRPTRKPRLRRQIFRTRPRADQE
jgi:hypothetical protein